MKKMVKEVLYQVGMSTIYMITIIPIIWGLCWVYSKIVDKFDEYKKRLTKEPNEEAE